MVSTVMVKVFWAAGSTTPTAGVTVSHLAPAVAVKEIGPPSVASVTACIEVENGVMLRLRMVVLKLSVGRGGETTSVTGIVTTGKPVTVMVTVEL